MIDLIFFFFGQRKVTGQTQRLCRWTACVLVGQNSCKKVIGVSLPATVGTFLQFKVHGISFSTFSLSDVCLWKHFEVWHLVLSVFQTFQTAQNCSWHDFNSVLRSVPDGNLHTVVFLQEVTSCEVSEGDFCYMPDAALCADHVYDVFSCW